MAGDIFWLSLTWQKSICWQTQMIWEGVEMVGGWKWHGCAIVAAHRWCGHAGMAATIGELDVYTKYASGWLVTAQGWLTLVDITLLGHKAISSTVLMLMYCSHIGMLMMGIHNENCHDQQCTKTCLSACCHITLCCAGFGDVERQRSGEWLMHNEVWWVGWGVNHGSQWMNWQHAMDWWKNHEETHGAYTDV